jgi:hypothetical protein
MKNIYAKLLKLNQALSPIKKDQDNPFYHSKYADINKIIGEVRPKLTELGLVVLQPLTSLPDGKTAIKTIIIDTESGETFGEDNLYPLIEMADPQKEGAVITYFRRYALLSALMLETEDDDCNSASGKVIQQTVSPVKPAYQKSTYKPYQAPVQKVANDEVNIEGIPFN